MSGTELRDLLDPFTVQSSQLKAGGLRQCLDYWHTSGVPTKVFAPFAFVSHDAEDGFLRALQAAEVLFTTPGGLDDDFMLSHADKYGSFIVSNDRFLDHSTKHHFDPGWLAYHRIGFMWDPAFAPDPNGVERLRQHYLGLTPPPFAAGRLRQPRAPTAPSSTVPAAQSGRGAPSSVTSPATVLSTQVLPGGDESMNTDVIVETVVKTKSLLRKQVGEDTPEVLVLEVPRGAAGRIIGARGTNIKALQELSGASVRVDTGQDPCIVHAQGGDLAVVEEVVQEKVELYHKYGNSANASNSSSSSRQPISDRMAVATEPPSDNCKVVPAAEPVRGDVLRECAHDCEITDHEDEPMDLE
ncbi:hypothetical protein CYMTET_40047 [Cymbomonas tetramitiformis]|uniref:K Homology domain-containing protein n=1 Tax=Cymbomonas tetramitiformis TaxID=36881 RepID=A0AAE0CA31_9CHLO|nr:hypothetical protein CYMTET_40047 [Cymbomonas tetramitiformis]